MARVEESLRVRRFDALPSGEEFSAQIEPTNVPAVFVGAIKDWEAISKWSPSDGGLDYLQQKVGSAVVEAMLSKSAPVFYGDLRSHERVPLPFSSFIASCKTFLSSSDSSGPIVAQSDSNIALAHSDEGFSAASDAPAQVYLAQVPILNMDDKESCPLDTLREDIKMPILLEMKSISSINLWMNRDGSRSGTHYDPYHNLLCVVAGCKQVVLWPPSASPLLYPMAIYGEASNHSAINIENPDLSIHPRAQASTEYSQKVILHSGDALFIPEGWFHQVYSDHLTIAVNFWWKSNMFTNMLEHMDAYYLRRILNRLVEKEKVRILQNLSIANSKNKENLEATNGLKEGCLDCESTNHSGKTKENGDMHGSLLYQLELSEVFVLDELISLVHDTVNVSTSNQAVQVDSVEDSAVNQNDEHMQSRKDDLVLLENDPIARIILTTDPLSLQRILLVMVHHFPRTLEALIMHMLSPIAAELLTRKFDQMDQQSTKAKQAEFYELFYSVFDDQYVPMDAILKGKEAFAFQAFKNVLDIYLGGNADRPN